MLEGGKGGAVLLGSEIYVRNWAEVRLAWISDSNHINP